MRCFRKRVIAVKVLPLKRNEKIYSAYSYLLLGGWSRIYDINTLIDVGTDAFIVDEIEHASTGIGKTPVEQIILTHNHFDHSSGLAELIGLYHPRVYAFSPGDGVTDLVKDGQLMHMGDEMCEVIHTPGHSSDSICIYCPAQKMLFSGDVPLSIKSPGSSYEVNFVGALERIARLDVRVIYSGHNEPVVSGAKEMIQMTLDNVRRSDIISAVIENRSP